MNATTDTLNIEIESSTKKATSGINRLVKSLEKLNTSLGGLSNLSKLQNLEKAFRPLQNMAPAKNLTSVINKLSKLPKIVESLDNKTLDEFAKKVKKISDALTPLSNKMAKVGSGFLALNRSFGSVGKAMNSTSKNTGSFSKKISNSVALGIGKFELIKNAILGSVRSIGKFVLQSAEYNEALNLFTVSMGKYAEEATKFTNRFSEALGVDPVQLMQYMGSFNSLIKGLGVGEENAYKMSKNMTQLAYDLASFRNIGIEEAFLKIQSGISGEIEPLRNVGIALSQATLQELAYSLGIKKRVADMTEAEKAELRYYQIMKSTTAMQGDMARTIIQPANALRVLSQQFVQLARAIGNIFMPLVMTVLPYLTLLTQLATKAAQAIANLFGYEIPEVDYSSLQTGIDIAQGGLDGVKDSAGKAAKAVSEILAPFDKLNVVSQPKDTGGGSGSGSAGVSGGGLGLDLPEYDALAGLIEGRTAKLVANLKEKFESLKGIISSIWNSTPVQSFVNAVQVSFEFLWNLISTIGMDIANNLNTTWNNISTNLGIAVTNMGIFWTMFWTNFAVSVEIGGQPVIDSISELFNSIWATAIDPALQLISQTWADFSSSLVKVWNEYGQPLMNGIGEFINKTIELFQKIYDNILEPIITPFLENLTWLWDTHLKGMIEQVMEFVAKLTTNALEVYNKFVQPIASFLLDILSPAFAFFGETVSGKLSTVWAFISEGVNATLRIFGGLSDFISGIFTANWRKAWNGIRDIFGGVFDSLKNLFKAPFNYIIDGINSFIKATNKIKIPDWVPGIGGKGFNIPKIPKLARGGIVDGPTIAMVGEAGREAVMPLENNTEWISKLGKDVSMRINNDNKSEETNRLLTEIYRKLEQINNKENLTEVNIGNDKIYSGFGQRVNSENDRYGKTVIKV